MLNTEKLACRIVNVFHAKGGRPARVCGSLVTIKQNRKDGSLAAPAAGLVAAAPTAKPRVMHVTPDGVVYLPGTFPKPDCSQRDNLD